MPAFQFVFEDVKIKALSDEVARLTALLNRDGTNTGTSPAGPMSSELVFDIEAPEAGEYELIVNYATGRQNGCGDRDPVSYLFCFSNAFNIVFYFLSGSSMSSGTGPII